MDIETLVRIAGYFSLVRLSFLIVAREAVAFARFSGNTSLAYKLVNRLAPAVTVFRLLPVYSSQPSHALTLQERTIQLAREMARESDLGKLEIIAAALPKGAVGLRADATALANMIAEIARQQRRLDTLDRPLFREPLAQALRTEIENFRYRVDQLHLRDAVATEFKIAATKWLSVAERQLQKARAVANKAATPQVFRAGDPVDRDKEAFVPRLRVISDLEGQLALATGCPGLLLYGRRRTGKSTTLKNLTFSLPSDISVATISMQNPEAFTSVATFASLIQKAVASVCTRENRDTPAPSLIGLCDALTELDTQLNKTARKRLLLAIDEYEMLDKKIGDNIFPIDLLSMLRESIQSHRRITWSFAGSHNIDELKHATWSSYLVSARTVEVPLFSEQETRQLLTDPLRSSSVWKVDDPRRPVFPAEFWGNNGIERIHANAGGWPHLVQLIAETTVNLVNESMAHVADDALLDLALDRAVVSGDIVLRQLVERESELPGEWEYLSTFRRRDSQWLRKVKRSQNLYGGDF